MDAKYSPTRELIELKRSHMNELSNLRLSADRAAVLHVEIALINKELRQRTKRRWRNTPPHLKGATR